MVGLQKKIPLIVSFFHLLLWIPSVQTQGYENIETNASGGLGSYINLTWNFNSEDYEVLRTRWLGPDNVYILTKLPGQPPFLPGFIGKLEYEEPFILRILQLNFSDNGLYTCEVTLNNSQQYRLPINLTVYDINGTLEHEIQLFGNHGSIDHPLTLGQDFQAIVQVPANDPPAVAVKITVQYVDSNSDYEDELSFLSGGPASFKITASSKGLLNITSLMEHPLSDNGFTSSRTIEVIDPYTSSLAPDDTSVSTDTPSTPEDPSVTQPSSSRTVTFSDDLTPDPQSGWSHWYILLIALGCLVILVVIAVVIHRRSPRKDDDLDPVTELEPPSVHAAPADHVRANTAGYRPSQHQQPRREDNTAYYVQGTSGARLRSMTDGRDLYMLTIQ